MGALPPTARPRALWLSACCLVTPLVAAGPSWAEDMDLSVEVEPPRVPQGGILQVRLRNFQGDGVRVASARWGSARVDGMAWAHGDVLFLLPVGITERLGTHSVEVRVPGARGDRVMPVPVVVVPGDFETDVLGVSRAFTEPTRAQRARAAADQRVFEAAW